MKSPRMGFIGCGEIARVHAHCLLKLGASINGCFDTVDAASSQFSLTFGGKKYNTAEELCADPDIDAVYICTKHDTHLFYIEMAATYDKPIFCEKPLALDYESAKKAYKIVQERNVKLMVGFNHRYSAGVTTLKQKLMNRRDDFHVLNINFVSVPCLDGWGGSAEEGGGVFVCLGSHVFDLVNFLCTEVDITDMKVIALKQRLDVNLMEDSFGVLVKTSKNQLITICSHDYGNERFSVDPGYKLNSIHVFFQDTVMVAETSNFTMYGPEIVEIKQYDTDKQTSWGYLGINSSFIKYLNGEEKEFPGVQAGLFASKMVESFKNMIL